MLSPAISPVQAMGNNARSSFRGKSYEGFPIIAGVAVDLTLVDERGKNF